MLVNQEKSKLVAGVGLCGTIVVNTKDVLLVIDKNHIGDIKEVLEKVSKKVR